MRLRRKKSYEKKVFQPQLVRERWGLGSFSCRTKTRGEAKTTRETDEREGRSKRTTRQRDDRKRRGKQTTRQRNERNGREKGTRQRVKTKEQDDGRGHTQYCDRQQRRVKWTPHRYHFVPATETSPLHGLRSVRLVLPTATLCPTNCFTLSHPPFQLVPLPVVCPPLHFVPLTAPSCPAHRLILFYQPLHFVPPTAPVCPAQYSTLFHPPLPVVLFISPLRPPTAPLCSARRFPLPSLPLHFVRPSPYRCPLTILIDDPQGLHL